MPKFEFPAISLPTPREIADTLITLVTSENDDDPPAVAAGKQRVADEYEKQKAQGEEAANKFIGQLISGVSQIFPAPDAAGEGGGDASSGTGGFGLPLPTVGTQSFEIPIPVPTFKVVPLEIPIPVPAFSASPLNIPLPVPSFEAAPLNIPLPVPLFGAAPFNLPVPGVPALPGSPFALPDVQALVAESLEALQANVTRDPMLGIVEPALNMWRLQAMFRDITITGPIAVGSPGCLTGPDFKDLVLDQVAIPGFSSADLVLASAVAEGVGRNFHRWLDAVIVPGLPWYPAFAAFPGPQAPPMPNTPTPLIACASSEIDQLVLPHELEAAINEFLPAEQHSTQMLERTAILGRQLSAFFGAWLSRQLVMHVLGMGPVPNYSPPGHADVPGTGLTAPLPTLVPVSMVMGGTIISVPGHLAT